MNKRTLIVVAITLVVAVGIGAWFVQRADANSASPYRMGEVALGSVESTVTATGRLTAIQSVAVGTQVSGQVIELYADYNDRVKAGQLIARIDPTLQEQSLRNAQANLERVQAALVQAERDYARNRTLFDQQVITEAEFNQVEYSRTVARANLTSAEVSLEQARRNLAYTQIYSPIDGVVVERNVEPGQTVAASMSAPQLYLLATDLKDIEILAGVDESDIGSIRNGMDVRFTVNAYPNDTFRGVVRQVRLASATQENVVNYTAVISVDNDDLRLVPGMTAEVDFIVERAENVFVVPNAALRFRPTDEMIAQLTDSTMIAIAQGAGGRGAMMAMARANGAGGDGAAFPGAPGNGGRGAGGAGASASGADASAGGANAGAGGDPASAGATAPARQAGAAGGNGDAGGNAPAGAVIRPGAAGGAPAGAVPGAGGRVRIPGGGAAAGARAGAGGGGVGAGLGGGAGAGGGAGGVGGRLRAQQPDGGGAVAAAAEPIADEGVFVLGGGRPATRNVRVAFAPLWYMKDGKLGVLRVRTGISDGTNTEISGVGLEEGMEIIIGLTQPETEAQGGTTNPFQQQRGGFGGGGGPVIIGPGGPGGGGGGGRGFGG